MNVYKQSKFKVGDRVMFLGSEKSRYGENNLSNEFIGSIVTIKAIHSEIYPDAYLFEEFEREYHTRYWFSENCFEMTLPDLPEFEPSCELDFLFN